jgi:hypothetical protein
VAGDGSNWNVSELGLLGDLSIAVPVAVFDDGTHDTPMPHEISFGGTLVFTPGARDLPPVVAQKGALSSRQEKSATIFTLTRRTRAR